MAQINFVVRQLIKLVYGAALAPGTFEEALTEFQAAASLNPSKLIHRVELGRTLLRLGRRQEALRELTASTSLEVEDVNARLQLDDAEMMLVKLRKEFERSVTPLAWGGFGDATGDAAAAAGGADAAEQPAAAAAEREGPRPGDGGGGGAAAA
jgi:predicted Zn-dependent protease